MHHLNNPSCLLYSSEAGYRMADLFFSIESVLCLMYKTDWFWRRVRINPGVTEMEWCEEEETRLQLDNRILRLASVPAVLSVGFVSFHWDCFPTEMSLCSHESSEECIYTGVYILFFSARDG